MSSIVNRAFRSRTLRYLAGGASVVVGLLLVRRFGSYLLFHSLVEVFSIVVTFGIFTVFWNARRFLDNGCFLFLGIAYLFVGGVDLLHTLAYEHMDVFGLKGSNLATQLWVGARFIESFSILAAPLFLHRRFPPHAVLAGYAAAVALLLASIFYWRVFPVCFEGGLTTFKVVSEYVICLVLLVSLVVFYRRRQELDARVYRLLFTSIVLTVASELVFTSYETVTDNWNAAGHFLKLFSMYLIYVAFVEVGLRNPYAVLFRNLKQVERELTAVNETLEERVAERTSLAEQRAAQLKALASELTLAEQRERRRLAQTLHDHLQQFLVTAKLKLGMLRRRASDEAGQPALQELEELLDEAINASRSLTVELSPPILYDAGLGAALEWLARQMQERHGLAVVVDTQPHTEPDTDQWRVLIFQAVRELLFNVVKHAGTQCARVEMTRNDEGELRVAVVDPGVGFDPSRVEAGDGGGFGLFSVRERLGLLGGRLEIDTAPGRGTRVSIFVPQAPLEGPKPAYPPSRVVVRASDAFARPGRSAVAESGRAAPIGVLLADDHDLLREGLVSLLRDHADMEVVGEASDGESAVELALKIRPDVVIMDVALPRLSGVEATRRIVASQPGIRVIGLSMHEQADMENAMRSAGAVDYLAKDGPTDDLVAAVRSAARRGP